MPSSIAGETSVDEREPAGLIGASRKRRKRKRNNEHDDMSPEEDSTASPPAGLIAGREEGQQRLTSPPSGSKFVHDQMPRDEFGETCLEESSIIKNRSEDGLSEDDEDDDEEMDEEENVDHDDDDVAEATMRSKQFGGNSVVGSGGGEDAWSTSDVENFDGKIVYNPDGSAYIIEDSELSDEDAELPQLIGNGCIVDGRGVKVTRNEGFPQIANAIYVSSKNQALHHTLYGNLTNYSKGGVPDKGVVPEVPVMHSYRVYSVRDNKYAERGDREMENRSAGAAGSGGGKDCSSVPVKPILMCFICKLSFGYAKSFVAHAMSDHNVMLQEDEKDLLSHKNTSAIIQCVGKEKEPLVSFLEPLSPPIVGAPLDGKYRPSVGQSSFSSSFLTGENNTQKVPNNNNNNINNKCNNNSSSSVKNNIADGNNGSSDYNNDNGAESLVTHRRDRSPQSSSQNQHVPETSVSLLTGSSRSSSNFNSSSNTNAIGSTNSGNSNSVSGASSPNVMNTSNSSNAGGRTIGGAAAAAAAAAPSMNGVMDLTRKSPISVSTSQSTMNSNSGGSAIVTSPGASPSPGSTSVGSLLPTAASPSMSFAQHPPNFLTGTTIGVCPDHMGGRPSGVDCSKCELILSSSRLGGVGGGPLAGMHSRNSCKTLKCPKCNWHYKYQETLEIHMKEKHPETETSCIYCIAGQPHPRLARGETYTCGYKPYRCEVCNYSTTTKGNLSIHMQSDKHLNNMQELQNGTVTNSDLSPHQPTAPSMSQPHSKPTGMSSPGAGGSGLAPYHSTISASQTQKPKPTFRCEVCNYETNVARNLRIHMTSEKHTHNILVLQQNMKQMQALSAIQQSQHQQQPNFEQLLHFHPALTLPGDKPPPHSEAALADMAYNQALLIQLMTGGHLPPNMSPELSPNMDMGLDPGTMEPPPEPADPNPDNLYQCCVCNIFTTNSLEALSQHLAADRTKIREQEILAIVAGHYVCKLCTYKTTLKANFQLHCKTDKHLQRLQHVNHVKEGGIHNEWKLKYVSSPGGVQVRCNSCDYYTNSTHKLQLHSATQRHEFAASLFYHLRDKYDDSYKIYHCLMCEFSCTEKLSLFQHIRSPKHFQIEHLHQLQRRSAGKDGQMEFSEMFKVIPQADGSSERERKNSSCSNATDRRGTPEAKDLSDMNNSFTSDHTHDVKSEGGSRASSMERDSAHTCPYCTYTCSSEMRIQAHILTQHSQTDENSSHQSQPPSSPKESFCCPLCQDKFADKVTLEKHVMQIHSVNSEGLQRLLMLVDQSHWLNSTTKPSANLQTTPPSQRHSPSSSTASSGGKDIEMRCAQSDSSKADTEEGDDTGDHLESDSSRCPLCGKAFRTNDDLSLHQNESGHFESKQVDGVTAFLCPKKDCNAFFTTVLNAQRHYLEVHIQRRMNTVAVSEKHVYKYRCNQCSLAFKTMEKLQVHSQYHLIRDATKCVLCGRSFRSILALQKHVESSHADLSEEEMVILKQSLLSNPLLLASLGGQVLDPSITELLKKESFRMDIDEALDEGSSKDEDGVNATGAENSEDEDETYKEQFIEDYLNSQAVAEENYGDPNRKYKCHKCKVAFTRQNYLTQHNKKVPHRKSEKVTYSMDKYMDPNRPYKCEVCIESFTQKNILLVHYNSVSHLHKLKRASQESQNNSPAAPANLMISPPSNHHQSTARSNSSSEEDDKKPYKCNVCNVAYPQVTTLDIHLRSVLHQTRVSRLQQDKECAQNSQGSQMMSSPSSASDMAAAVTTASSTSSPVTSSTQSSQMAGIVSCPRCNAFFVSQEQLHTHQQLYCPFGSVMNMFPSLSTSSNLNLPFSQPTDMKTPPPPSLLSGAVDDSFMKLPPQAKKSSHMYKHLLESFGFDLVMQFNENHQRRQRKEREESERLLAELHQSAQLMSSEEKPMAVEEKKENPTDADREDKEEVPAVAAAASQDLSEISKSTCAHCNKEFSSVWVLKAHCEEVHKDLVPLDFLEKYAQQIKCEIEKKVVPGSHSVANDADAAAANESLNKEDNYTGSSATTADVGTDTYSSLRDEKDSADESGALNMSTGANATDTSMYDDSSEKETEDTKENITKTHHNHDSSATPNHRTACSTPASSTESMPPSAGGVTSSNPSPNISMSLAQQMNEMQAALNAMAASQLQQQLQQFNPMMMGMASLGMGLPVGLNMPALAAMNLQPPLVPMMMPPPSFDPIGLGSAQNALFSQQTANMDATSLLAKQQQHMIQQQQQQVASASQQKRARTRITDDQLKILRAHFDINNSPSEEQINKMAAESGLPPKVIKHWFRNTLFKERQRNKDSPYNFNNPPSTTLNLEEYEKTGEAKVMPLNSTTPEEHAQPINTDSMLSKMSPPPSNKKSCTPSPKIEQMSLPQQQHPPPPQHFQNHSLPQPTSFSVPHTVPSSPVQIKSEPKDTPQSPVDHQLHVKFNNLLTSEAKFNSMLPSDVESRVKKEEFDDVKPNVYAHERESHLPVSPNISDCFSHNLLSCGNSNSSNSSGGSTGKRANRTRFTDYQIKVLQEFFENNAYPKDDDLEYLSKLLSLSPRVIVVWFQNARQKARKVYENQPPVEPAPGVDENTGRFQRTPGLNYQCKKCLLVFQRYYELIRHQKTHCFKEEDAKRSAQAQAAAAQMAAVLSSEDSNSSTIVEQSQQCNVTNSNPSTPAAAVTPTPSSAYPPSPVAHNPSTPESKENTLQCENCNLVFPRFELWREHQLIHIMNPNLFPNYAPESPFGILQQQAQQQAQQQQQQQQQQLQSQGQHSQQQQHQSQSHESSFNSNSNSEMNANSNPTSPHPVLAMFNSSKRKYEEYVYLSERDADQPKDKRLRTTIRPDQLDYLYQKYQIESNPSRKMLETIANEVELKKRVVQVWFQNTRARERKGQFRAHAQAINKRCPFCPALFKVKSALETHLTAKHPEQCSRGEINIDQLPNEEESMDSVSFLTPSQGTGAGSVNQMMHPLLQSAIHASAGAVRGLDKQNYSALFSNKSVKNEEPATQGTGECPLDLSKPVGNCDNNYSESECSENMDDESEPASPESGAGKQQLTPEAIYMLQQLYGLGLATGFPQNLLQSSNVVEKMDEQLSLNSRFKKMETGPEEEDWTSDEEREPDNNNKMQMASPSKTYNSSSELYNQSLTPAETTTAQSLKLTYQ